VELSQAGPGTSIRVTAATGAAGMAALEIGCLCGVNIIGTTRFERNRAFLEEVGADHVYIAETGDLADALRGMTDGKGIDAAFDCVGAGMIHQYSPALALDARIYFYGFLDAQFPELPLVDMFQANGRSILTRCSTTSRTPICAPRARRSSTTRSPRAHLRRGSIACTRWRATARRGTT